MAFGLTTTGFAVKRLPDIKRELEVALRETYGDVDLSESSVFGQLVGVFAKPAADLWELMQIIYDSLNPSAASGIPLDDRVALNGITRLPATRSEVLVALLCGTAPTTISSDTVFSVASTGKQFKPKVDTEVTANASAATAIRVTINEAVNLETYGVQIGINNIVTDTGSGETVASIAEQIVADINASILSSTHFAWWNGGDTFDVYVIDKETVFNSAVTCSAGTGKIEIVAFGQFTAVEASELGAVSGAAFSITTIETPVAGLDGVINYSDAVYGREAETDTELRARRLSSLQLVGAGTVEAVRARIQQDVPGVVDCFVFENITDAVNVDGLPAHSLHAVVDIPDTPANTLAVADMLWLVKPAGIRTYGATSGTVIDSQGTAQTLYFDRPTPQYVHLRITYSLNPEEIFPSDGESQITAAILEIGAGFSIGADLIIQKFYKAIYSVVGISEATIEMGITPNAGDTPTYGTVNIAIGKTSKAIFASDRVHYV
jgi:uncharacterized phage protein gp47/JayE